jgi:hypothetical protein
VIKPLYKWPNPTGSNLPELLDKSLNTQDPVQALKDERVDEQARRKAEKLRVRRENVLKFAFDRVPKEAVDAVMRHARWVTMTMGGMLAQAYDGDVLRIELPGHRPIAATRTYLGDMGFWVMRKRPFGFGEWQISFDQHYNPKIQNLADALLAAEIKR